MSRYYLIELEGQLPDYRKRGIWCAARQITGVRSITDIEFVSQATLDILLLQPPPEPLVVSEPFAEQLEWSL